MELLRQDLGLIIFQFPLPEGIAESHMEHSCQPSKTGNGNMMIEIFNVYGFVAV